MARNKKKLHSSAQRTARGEKPVQVWFNAYEWERLARASQAAGKTMTGFVKSSSMRSVFRVIKADLQHPRLPNLDERI